MPVLDGHDAAAVQAAAAHLAAGELLGLPTETVYGLAADADNPAAVAAVFATKGRPADHPLIVHVVDAAAATRYTPGLNGAAQALVAAFWPGPLTLIVPRRPGVADAAAGGQPTIGLRSPSHPVARALLQAAAAHGVGGVAAPSANRFGRVSPTTAAHVRQELGDALWVLDGGPCEVGIESAIVDCSGEAPALLRPGGIDRRRLEQVLGRPLAAADAASPRAPGTLASHYAPTAPVRLWDTPALAAALAAPGLPEGVAVYSRLVPPAAARVAFTAMPDNAAQAAHDLFAVLRGFDAAGASLIWVERPPATPEWDGVRDRLQRAAAA